jgi:hypothetical protein
MRDKIIMQDSVTFFAEHYGEIVKCVIKIEIRNATDTIDWDTLSQVENRETLSFMGEMYGGKKFNKPISWGQICDSFTTNTKGVKELCDFWRKYHLNDLNAGTKSQSELIESRNKKYDYVEVCKFLEEKNMLIDRGYRYGTAWLSREFPKDELLSIIAEIKSQMI